MAACSSGPSKKRAGGNSRSFFCRGWPKGLFPQRTFEDPLLLDEFRRDLDAPLALRDDRVKQERLRLRLAVGAARDRLIASYPRMDVAEARPRVPSFYALELPRAIEGHLPELKEFEKQARDAAPARLNWPAPADAARGDRRCRIRSGDAGGRDREIERRAVSGRSESASGAIPAGALEALGPEMDGSRTG